LLTTHYMDEAEVLCDRVAIIDAGRIVATGTPEALIAQAGLSPRVALTASRPFEPGILEQLSGVDDVQIEGSRARFRTPRPAALLAPLAQALESRGIEVLDLTV